MKKITLITLSFVFTLNVIAQSIKKEYYDYRKTQIMAKFQVNSVGEKHGWFKGYDRNGVVVYEYNYKNNLWHGVNKEYSTHTGSRTLSKTETYKKGVLNGPASYYAGTGSKKGRFIKSSGSYLEGEKNGKWMYKNSFDSYGMPEDWKSKAQFIKFSLYYNNGKEIFPDGEMKISYSPSGQTQTQGFYLNGQKTGDWKWFFPSGKLQAIASYKKDKYVGKRTIYNMDGSIKTEEFYEDYEALSDLYEDSALAALESYKFELAEQYFTKMKSMGDAQRMKYMVNAANLRAEKKYIESMNQINLALKGINNNTIRQYWQDVYKEYISKLDSNFATLIKYESIEGLKNELKKCKTAFEDGDMYQADLDRYSKIVEDYEITLKAKEEELNKLVTDFNAIIDSYKEKNVKQVQTFLMDENGKPIMKDSFIKGKYIYKKSMIILDPLIEEFNEQIDLKKKKLSHLRITEMIETLNNIPESEWKSLNKKLKKVDDPEEIKAILHI